MTRLVPRTSQNVRISPQLIMRYELLRLPSQELSPYLRELSYVNPLLGVKEHQLCPQCGHVLGPDMPRCYNCDPFDYVPPGRSYSDPVEDEAAANWMESLNECETLQESLWRQCLENDFDEEAQQIACHLIADLDEHGYLNGTPDTHATELGVPVEAVEQVRQRLMRLDPLGIASVNARECLLIQARMFTRDEPWVNVARRLVEEQWQTLMEGKLRRAARALKLPPASVEQAFRLMVKQFHLYPAYGRVGLNRETHYLQPDVRFRMLGRGPRAEVEIEVLEADRYKVGIRSSYRDLLGGNSTIDRETNSQLMAWARDVRRVMTALRQRWDTLQRVCDCIIDFQRDFFIKGDFRATALHPLTRDEVANALGVHPSTVGRAVNGKYAELPNRKIVPLSFFFDSSAPIQALIAQLISNETTLLSDETLRRHLQRAGWRMTRRAVSLHRESMGILPTHLRRRQRKIHEIAPGGERFIHPDTIEPAASRP